MVRQPDWGPIEFGVGQRPPGEGDRLSLRGWRLVARRTPPGSTRTGAGSLSAAQFAPHRAERAQRHRAHQCPTDAGPDQHHRLQAPDATAPPEPRYWPHRTSVRNSTTRRSRPLPGLGGLVQQAGTSNPNETVWISASSGEIYTSPNAIAAVGSPRFSAAAKFCHPNATWNNG